MPHDVTMPQLGMAQDAGKIVSWLKAPGDAVAKGDALFEVETDKAVMEVEAVAAGFLTGVTASEGDDVPVGQVIATISDSKDGDGSASGAAPDGAGQGEASSGKAAGNGDLPQGHSVTMPQLGMAQDSGLLVTWLKSPGDQVAADDILFEVETDKSTMEVEAGRAGWLAATLAEAGEEVPVGGPVAIITEAEPDTPIARSVSEAGRASEAASEEQPPQDAPDPVASKSPAAAKTATKAPAKAGSSWTGGRILASPKARRLALEQGLDLERLADAGHPQPFHVADLEVLRSLPDKSVPAASAEAPRRLTAACGKDGLSDFVPWAAEIEDLAPDAVLAGLAGASLGRDGTATVAIERFERSERFAVPAGRRLSSVTRSDDAPDLIVRDLRGTAVASVAMGAEDVPVLTIAEDGQGLSITLECAGGHLDAGAAIRLLTTFAGRMEQPLRHLL